MRQCMQSLQEELNPNVDTITSLGNEQSWTDPQPHSHTQMGFPLSEHTLYPGPSRRLFLTAEFVTKSTGMTEDT